MDGAAYRFRNLLSAIGDLRFVIFKEQTLPVPCSFLRLDADCNVTRTLSSCDSRQTTSAVSRQFVHQEPDWSKLRRARGSVAAGAEEKAWRFLSGAGTEAGPPSVKRGLANLWSSQR